MAKLSLALALAVVGVPGFALGLLFVSAAASPSEATPAATEIVIDDVPPAVTAKSYYVFDLETGRPLVTLDETTPRPIASVTKLIATAAYLVDATDATTTITAADVAIEGESGRLQPGMSFTARELAFPALLESSNDAAAAQLRVYPGDLLLSMHGLAGRADALDAAFVDAAGLSSGNIASAKSLGSILSLIWLEQPHVFDITRLNKYVDEETTWINNSPLYDLPGYQGGKHGYTHDAGRTAAVVFTDTLATGEFRSIGYVLLGSSDLKADTKALRTFVSAHAVLQ